MTITDTINVTSALNVAGYMSASQGYATSRGYITTTPGVDLNLNNKQCFHVTGIIYVYTHANLETTCTSARVVLSPGSGLYFSTYWYGLGMNSGQ